LQQLDLDGQLDHAKLDPSGFLRQLNEVSEPERRSRIAPLVVRASHRGDAQVVARRLRDTSHPLASALAAEFDRMPSNLSMPSNLTGNPGKEIGNPRNPVGSASAIPASY
jgi:hypothetical protein